MGTFKNNPNGTRTWTNSSGTYSYTRDSKGNMISRTMTSTDGKHSTTMNYSQNRRTSVSRTHNGVTKVGKY